MARPKKNNADYFSHDADMRNDLKVKALRNKFGITGYAVWCMILEVLTDKDYFEYDWSEVSQELMSADFGIDSSLLMEIVEYCKKLKLLTYDNSTNTIFSQRHKERFNGLLTKRERDRIRVFVSDNSKQPEVFASENPQSKVKYSKVNIIKNNNIDICGLKPSSTGQLREVKKVFTPPSKEDVITYFAERAISPEDREYFADKFLNFYESKNWMVGKNKMANWKAAASRSLEWEDKRRIRHNLNTSVNELWNYQK